MAIPSRPPNRAIPQTFGDINNTDLNEIFRRLSELSSSIEGRRGPIILKDSEEILTSLRKTLLKFRGKGDRATGSISFEGETGSSMFIGKGCYQTDSGAWIATENSPLILELNANSVSPRMYRNVGVAVGAEFTPNPIGYIAVGDESGLVAPGSITHGGLAGLGADDHTQYLKEKLSGGLASEIPVHAHTSGAEAGQLDHGLALTGLLDDDHPQYAPVQNGFDTAGTGDSTLSFVDGTRTFTITPVGSCTVWSGGNRFVKTLPESLVITDVEGLHNIYFDSTGTLQELVGSFDPTVLIEDNAFVASVYWNATANRRETFLNERHGREMDSSTHRYLHRTFGTRYDTGLALTLGAPADSSGASDTHAQFAVADGIIWDEDIRIEILDGAPQQLSPSPAQLPIYYLEGVAGNWRRIAATNFPVSPTGTGRPAWNNIDAGGVGVWGLTEITNNDFLLAHVFAVDDIENPVIVIMGQNRYTTLANARDGADVEIQSITTGQIQGAFNEFLAVASVIFECKDVYANAVNARIRTTTTGDDYVDWRFVKGGGAGGISVSDHNSLSGLQGGLVTERYHLEAAEHAIATDPTFARGGVLFQPSGLSAGGNVIVWEAPFNCDVQSVRGYRVGGTGATVNARKNGTSNHLAAALSVTVADTWMDGGAVQNISYTVGDRMEIMVVTVAGSPTQVAVQVNLRRT